LQQQAVRVCQPNLHSKAEQKLSKELHSCETISKDFFSSESAIKFPWGLA
jgi:hypothetical protein